MAKKSDSITVEELAKHIDHSLLRPELTEDDVVAGCATAKQYNVASVCVRPCDVRLAADLLKDSSVLVCTVVGFPHGSNDRRVKVFESATAMDDGATELDVVLNIGQLRSGNEIKGASTERSLVDYVLGELEEICELTHSRNCKVKIILENALLTDAQKVLACQICERAGADWVKTSTGYATSGATVADLRLMRKTVSEKIQIKAAGGLRTLSAVLEAIDQGVTRVGASATAAILDELKAIRKTEGK